MKIYYYGHNLGNTITSVKLTHDNGYMVKVAPNRYYIDRDGKYTETAMMHSAIQKVLYML